MVAHLLYIDAFIARGRITIVYPQEAADLKIFPWFLTLLAPLRCQANNLPRSQISIDLKSQVGK